MPKVPPPDIDNMYKLIHWVNMEVGEDTTRYTAVELMRKLVEKGIDASAVWKLHNKLLGIPPITPEEFDKFWYKYIKP